MCYFESANVKKNIRQVRDDKLSGNKYSSYRRGAKKGNCFKMYQPFSVTIVCANQTGHAYNKKGVRDGKGRVNRKQVHQNWYG